MERIERTQLFERLHGLRGIAVTCLCLGVGEEHILFGFCGLHQWRGVGQCLCKLSHTQENLCAKEGSGSTVGLLGKRLRDFGNGFEGVAAAEVGLGSIVERSKLLACAFGQLIQGFAHLVIASQFAKSACQQQVQANIVGLGRHQLFEHGKGIGVVAHAEEHLGLVGQRLQVVGMNCKGRIETFLCERKFAHVHGAHAIVAQGLEIAFLLLGLFGRQFFGAELFLGRPAKYFSKEGHSIEGWFEYC